MLYPTRSDGRSALLLVWEGTEPMTERPLEFGKDWNAWAWRCPEDPLVGAIMRQERRPERFEFCYHDGKWVRVRITIVDPDTKEQHEPER
jgi:hypothetical protein